MIRKFFYFNYVYLNILFIIIYYCFLLFDTNILLASNRKNPQINYNKLLQNIDNINFYLITIDVGPELYMSFGHSVLRIQDNNSRFDWVYNWGVFDFDEPFFLIKFLRGNLKYKMEEYPFSFQLQMGYLQKRTMWQDKINLTANQKRKLLEKIIWQSLPENRYFKYLYFKQNCSTLLRDYLDYALNGLIKQQYINKMSHLTFRQTVIDHLSINPFAAMGVDFIFNSNTDKKMNIWEEMFKPKQLRQYLSYLTSYDDNGNPISSTKLLDNSQVLMKFEPPKKFNFNGYHFIFFILFIPFSYISWSVLKKTDTKIVRLLIAITTIFWGLFSFIASIILLWFWLDSYQNNCYHNVNLWFFWPLDFVCVYIGILFLTTKKISKYLNYFCIAHIISIIIAMLLWSMGLIQQDIRNTLYFFVPFSFLIYWNILRYQNNYIEKQFNNF